MWSGFFGPTASFNRGRDPAWIKGFRSRTADNRAYIMFFAKGYPHVADGPIQATGWYALDLHEWEKHPYGPFPSRIAASAWWKRWIANHRNLTGDALWRGRKRWWIGYSRPRDWNGFVRSGPVYGFKPVAPHGPRRFKHPLSSGRTWEHPSWPGVRTYFSVPVPDLRHRMSLIDGFGQPWWPSVRR